MGKSSIYEKQIFQLTVEIPMLSVYETGEWPQMIVDICEEASETLKTTITKLEKAIK